MSSCDRNNSKDRPWLTPAEQVAHLKLKGVRFELMSEAEATDYLIRSSNFSTLSCSCTSRRSTRPSSSAPRSRATSRRSSPAATSSSPTAGATSWPTWRARSTPATCSGGTDAFSGMWAQRAICLLCMLVYTINGRLNEPFDTSLSEEQGCGVRSNGRRTLCRFCLLIYTIALRHLEV